MPDIIANYDMCIVKSMRLDSNIISRANKMKLIMQFGVGLEGDYHLLISLQKKLLGFDSFYLNAV